MQARQARQLQAAHGQVAGEETFLRILRAHFVPGTWKPDHIVDPADGTTLLHYAVTHSFPEAVRYLLAQGANPGIRDETGTTPLDLARQTKQEEIVRLLEEAVAARQTAATAAAQAPSPSPQRPAARE